MFNLFSHKFCSSYLGACANPLDSQLNYMNPSAVVPNQCKPYGDKRMPVSDCSCLDKCEYLIRNK